MMVTVKPPFLHLLPEQEDTMLERPSFLVLSPYVTGLEPVEVRPGLRYIGDYEGRRVLVGSLDAYRLWEWEQSLEQWGAPQHEQQGRAT